MALDFDIPVCVIGTGAGGRRSGGGGADIDIARLGRPIGACGFCL